MADNAPVPEGGPQPPALPVAPPLKQGTVDKNVVPLSSVAKAEPAITPVAPPPLPAKNAIPEGKLPPPDGNSKMRLPPKAIKPRGATSSAAAEAVVEPSPEPVAGAGKLPVPHLVTEAKREGNPPPLLPPPVPTAATSHRAPALKPLDATPITTLPPNLLPKPQATTVPDSLVTGPITKPEKSDATGSSSLGSAPPLKAPFTTSGPISVKTEENKPALRPPVLPNKTLLNLKAAEATAVESSPGLKGATAEKTPPPAGTSPTSPASQSPELDKLAALSKEKAPLPPTRAERAKKRRFREMVFFYLFLLVAGALLYVGTIRFSRETRVEGQVIPPKDMPLADEVWIVSDFRQLTAGIAEDLAEERAPLLQEMHERQDHVQRVQADIAVREERIRLLQEQIQAAKDEETSVVKKAHDDAQQLWDGPGAQLDDEYNARSRDLKNAIESRAKSLNLKYAPDPTYDAPEVWANAYRLALYEVPAGVNSAKEYDWLNGQMKAWRDFVKAQDDQREQLREQAAEIKLSPASKLTDLNAKIDDLQHRIDNTRAEEEPLTPELQQAQADLADVETTESGLDGKYYKQLSALPSASITKRLPLDPYGRFTWPNLEQDSPFAEGENEHHYWLFARATRADGREYWALGRFSITKDHTVGLLIDPSSFVSTKAMLRPELSPDEQEQ